MSKNKRKSAFLPLLGASCLASLSLASTCNADPFPFVRQWLGGSFPTIDQTLHWGQLRMGDGGVTIRVPFLQAQSRPELAQGSQRLLRACYVPGTCDYIL